MRRRMRHSGRVSDRVDDRWEQADWDGLKERAVEVMPRAYGEMADEDLARIYAYLRTVPPAGAKSSNQQKAAP